MLVRYYSCDFQNAETGEWERSSFRYTMQRIETFKHVRAVEDDFVEIECEGDYVQSWDCCHPLPGKGESRTDWALVRSLTDDDLEPDSERGDLTAEDLAKLEWFEANSDEERRRKLNQIQDRLDREGRQKKR
tara:strand:- start:282 stop:677 length:396 start_codon:yes stop_codon:yes gene_type:complete